MYSCYKTYSIGTIRVCMHITYVFQHLNLLMILLIIPITKFFVALVDSWLLCMYGDELVMRGVH